MANKRNVHLCSDANNAYPVWHIKHEIVPGFNVLTMPYVFFLYFNTFFLQRQRKELREKEFDFLILFFYFLCTFCIEIVWESKHWRTQQNVELKGSFIQSNIVKNGCFAVFISKLKKYFCSYLFFKICILYQIRVLRCVEPLEILGTWRSFKTLKLHNQDISGSKIKSKKLNSYWPI